MDKIVIPNLIFILPAGTVCILEMNIYEEDNIIQMELERNIFTSLKNEKQAACPVAGRNTVNICDINKATSAIDTQKIIPRAEFRIFGQGIIDIVKAAMWKFQVTLCGTRQSGEAYIISRHNNSVNVKVRDGLLDIKIKVDETDAEYEIFQPGGKFQFPVQREELAGILEHLKAETNLCEERYNFDAFLELVASSNDLASVDVYKERYGFTVDGVICEYGRILFNGAMLETACVESENYDAMEEVITKLEIGGFQNVNYMKAAKRVVGM